MKKLFFSFWLLALGFGLLADSLSAQAVELIDLPTAEVIDANHFNTNFRLYKGGGILVRAGFGIGKRVNIGISFNVPNFIGAEKIDVQEPALQFKYRFYDGAKNIPALALGYDKQAYGYDTITNEYKHREKGLYCVASQEMLPHTEFHFGLNIYDFQTDQFFGFLGISWAPTEEFVILTELDNIHKLGGGTRVNLGLRYLNSPNLSIEVSARNITHDKDNERIIRLNYQGKF